MSRNAIQLNPQHPVTELKQHYQHCTCAVERRRTHVIWLLASGIPRDQVIQITAYSLPSVLDAIHRYNQNGLDGLHDLRHTNPGAPTLLSDQDILLLAQTIRNDFKQGIVWSGMDVLKWTQTKLGIQIRFQRAYELLEAIGFSLQIPRPRHTKSSDAARGNFKKTPFQTLFLTIRRT